MSNATFAQQSLGLPDLPHEWVWKRIWPEVVNNFLNWLQAANFVTGALAFFLLTAGYVFQTRGTLVAVGVLAYPSKYGPEAAVRVLTGHGETRSQNHFSTTFDSPNRASTAI